jgi:hypothetical protein
MSDEASALLASALTRVLEAMEPSDATASSSS